MLVVFLTAVVCGKFSGKCYVNNFTHISLSLHSTFTYILEQIFSFYSLWGRWEETWWWLKFYIFFAFKIFFLFFFVVCVFDPHLQFTVHTYKNSIIIPSNLMKISYALSTTDLASDYFFLFVFSSTPDGSIKKRFLALKGHFNFIAK